MKRKMNSARRSLLLNYKCLIIDFIVNSKLLQTMKSKQKIKLKS